MQTRRILILGASYGSLLGIKLALAGHAVKLACLAKEAAVINAKGAVVRMPVRGVEQAVEINSQTLAGRLSADEPASIRPGDYELVVLAMQEPQYRLPGVRELLGAVAHSRVPCMSIMNMPPLPYLARLPGLDVSACRDSYTEPSLWDAFDPAVLTLCSPDPQAFRPPKEDVNVLEVRLATNFKAARFVSVADTALLQELSSGIDAARLDVGGRMIELPVKLKVHESVFVPLAKWSMLLAGNYRCVQAESMRSIREAVHGDIAATRDIYEWVGGVCLSLGASRNDLVPFEKYAEAARSLITPSSAARALASGARYIERVDRLVQAIAAQRGLRSPAVDAIVATVDAWLARNRRAD